MPTLIDHITVTAPTLAVGAARVRRALGVDLETGGEHPRMGTHNLLLRLGDALFIEVIAPNPAVASTRPRWFGLDALRADAAPTLAVWVARTTDIAASRAAATEDLGAIEPIRRGALDWLITIPVDGSVPLDGAAPALIDWRAGGHPAAHLPERGLSLARFDVVHPDPARIERLLASIDLEGPVTVSMPSAERAAGLYASIDTPHGLRTL